MLDFKDFIYKVGETVMFCQIVERDIKIIYSAMLQGDFGVNFQEVGKDTLGQVVAKLYELDFSDSNHLLSDGDYRYLRKITQKRNHWCHHTFVNFIYNENFLKTPEYQTECEILVQDNEKLNSLFRNVEAVKKEAIKRYGRI